MKPPEEQFRSAAGSENKGTMKKKVILGGRDLVHLGLCETSHACRFLKRTGGKKQPTWQGTYHSSSGAYGQRATPR